MFHIYSGLYFWSLLITALLGVIPDALGLLLKYFKLAPIWIPVTLSTGGWAIMVTGQSLVLYSRLHLILRDQRILRCVLAMIIVDAIILQVPQIIASYGVIYACHLAFGPFFNTWEKVQLTGFFVQEIVISSIFIVQTVNLLRSYPTRSKRRTNIMYQLLVINLAIILMDISLIVIEFIGLFIIQTVLKTFFYTIKLKLEIAVLSRLVSFAPVVVMNTNSGERQVGRRAQMSNITAAKTVADIIRSCLGPKAMLKMLLDPMGGIVLTNDGHAILREIEVSHPAAKSMIELSRTQDEEVGDGTTTVIILAGEMLAQAIPQLERNIHPVVIIQAFKRALADALQIVEEVSKPVDINDDKVMYSLIQSSIGTKFVSRWSELMCSLALRAVRTVSFDVGGGKQEVDIKRYARVEKIPGGQIEDSEVIDGVMVNKDITHPKMRRRIENPRILLLDCPLEYKKGESQTNIEISKEDDWNRILQIEEEQVKHMCEAVLAFKPDVVITEKGISDLAQHFLMKANITALRRVRKTDNNRIARASGATIVNRVDDIQESDIGTGCGLFEIEKIGDEYFTFMRKCKSPKACTILLRGPSKDILNEVERNLQDAMSVARNVIFHPRLSPGGGAVEMAVSVKLSQLARSVEGVQQWPYKAVADAMEVIPRTLAQNAGASPIRVLTQLRAKHVEGHNSWGLDGDSGKLVDMKEYGVWEPEAVKLQSIKTAVESACLLLRVDDICSGKSAQQLASGGGGGEE
ncbi:unnamed protein product [Penicillium olsonii]|nr:unnamed protein product [Penicillium olsonii]